MVKVTTTISMSIQEREAIENYCKANNHSISGLLVKSAINKIKEEELKNDF